MRFFGIAVIAMLVACNDPPAPKPRSDAAASAPSTAPSAVADAETYYVQSAHNTIDASISGVLDASLDANATAIDTTVDAGASACRVLYGPEKMVFVGPAAIRIEGGELSLVANDGGKPKLFKFPITPIPPASVRAPDPIRPASTFGVMWPPCAVAGAYTICPGRAGSIMRTDFASMTTKEIVKGRPATRIAASAIGGSAGGAHTVTAYLDEKITSEGRVIHAFAMLDDGDPVRLSDEGSGATSIDLAPFGNGGDAVVAMYIDARAAMSPIHARVLHVKKGTPDTLDMGKDVVVAVGGAPERGMAGKIGVSSKHALLLVPMDEDTTTFGMGAIVLSEPLKEDEKIIYSRYPNGIDPAPIAATHGTSPIRVARYRPLDHDRHGPRGLELGTLADDGAFVSQGVVSAGKRVTDLDIATDSFGATWIVYGDASDTWLERRACP